MNKFYYEVFLDVHGNKTSIVKGLKDSNLGRHVIGIKEDNFLIQTRKKATSKVSFQLCSFSEFTDELFFAIREFMDAAKDCKVTISNFRTRSLAPTIPVASFHQANDMFTFTVLLPLFKWLTKQELSEHTSEDIKDDEKSN